MAGPKLDPEVLAHLEWLGFVRPIGLVVSAPALVRAGAILDRRDSEGQWLLRSCVEERTFDPKEGSDPCVRDFRRCSLKRDIQGFKPGMTESKASPRLFSRCSKRVERVRTGSTEELGQTIGVFLAASLTDHMCMPSGRCKSVLILWTVGLFDCHSLTFYFWVDIERTRPRRPSGSTEKPPPETQPRIQTECGAFFRLISAYISRNRSPGEWQRWRCPMPRLPKNSDRDFSASQSEDDIHADIAELFASQPPEWDDFSADPLVRMRKGTLITEAMNKPTTPQRVHDRRSWRGASQYDSWYFGCITRK